MQIFAFSSNIRGVPAPCTTSLFCLLLVFSATPFAQNLALQDSMSIDRAGLISDRCFANADTAATVPGQHKPALCTALSLGTDTSIAGANEWLDNFNHGHSFTSFDSTAYRVYEAVDGVFRSAHWRHADHWMVDIAPNAPDALYATAAGGSVMRPDSTFRFDNGLLSYC